MDNLGKTTTIAHILPSHEINTQWQKVNPKPNSCSHNKIINNPILTYRVSFEDFCDVAKSGNQQENNLTKIGYILDMKIGKKQNPYFFGLFIITPQKKFKPPHSKNWPPKLLLSTMHKFI